MYWRVTVLFWSVPLTLISVCTCKNVHVYIKMYCHWVVSLQTGQVATPLSAGGEAIPRTNSCTARSVSVPNTGQLYRSLSWEPWA